MPPGLRHLILVLLLTASMVAAAAAAPPLPRLPLFRAPNASETAAAVAAGAAFAWSAHEPEDALRVVSDPAPLALACLLDGGGGGSEGDLLELSWTVEDEAAGARTRHTLTAGGGGSAAAGQTFSLDIGPGLQPASGLFRQFAGSVLTVAFPVPAPGPVSVGCDLRIGGAVAFSSARLRLWDERPAAAALAASESAGLDCRRARRRLLATTPDPVAAVTLDCAAPMPLASPLTARQLPLLLETAVYGLHAAPVGRDCGNADAASPSLRTNATDASAFFAAFHAGRLRLGWTVEGDGAALEAAVWGGRLCVSADAAMPSRRRRLRLSWRVRVLDDAGESNVTVADDSFALELAGADVAAAATVTVDQFEDPPVPRTLPCPHLCPAALAATAACKFAWLHAPRTANASAAHRPPDASIGWLARPHSLLLLPWQPPGNPGPPPLSGAWTCRSEAAVARGLSSSSSPSSPQFLVRVTARPSLCGSRMPARSVVFLPPGPGAVWSARQSLGINCTVCGLDPAATADARLSLHGSLGGVDAAVEQLAGRLSGGVMELGLRFTRLRLTGGGSSGVGGSALLRCRVADGRGRGLVAYATVEALPAPAGAALDADCGGDGGGGNLDGAACGRFRCPLDPALAAALPRLGVTVAFLFTLQPRGGEPPQQVLASSDRLVTDASVARLRCTQLLYYADDDIDSSRQQRFAAADAASAAAHRAALGERRHARLLLAVESGWLETLQVQPPAAGDSGLRRSLQQNEYNNGYRAPEKASGTDPLDIIVGVILVVCALVGIFFVLSHYRVISWQPPCLKKDEAAAAAAAAPATGTVTASGTASSADEAAAAAAAADAKAPPKKKKKKKKLREDEDTAEESDDEDKPAKKKKAKKKKKAEDGQESDEAFDDEASAKTKKKKKKKKTDSDDAEAAATHNLASRWRSRSMLQAQPPQPPQMGHVVQMAELSTSTTRATPTPTPPTPPPPSPTSPPPPHRDFGGSFVTLSGGASPVVMSWDVYAECSTTSPGASSPEKSRPRYRRCSPTAVVNEDAATAASVTSDVVVVAAGSGAASAVASTRPGPPVPPPLRLHLRDRPELRTEAAGGSADAEVADAATSDDAADSTTDLRSPPAAFRARDGRVAELARLGRCLTCHPPRFRVATHGVGVEISVPSVDSADAEVDVPSSDLPGSTASVTRVAESEGSLVAEPPQPPPPPPPTPQLEDADDAEMLTGTGCCSESPLRSVSDEAEAETGEATMVRMADEVDDEEDSAMVRQAVRSAIERLTED